MVSATVQPLRDNEITKSERDFGLGCEKSVTCLGNPLLNQVLHFVPVRSVFALRHCVSRPVDEHDECDSVLREFHRVGRSVILCTQLLPRASCRM